MSKNKLTTLERPFICATIWEDSKDDVMLAIRESELMGADAFDLELLSLYKKLTTEDIKDILSTTSKPIYTTLRRRDPWGRKFEGSEEERINFQIKVFEMGSIGFDMEADTFAPSTTQMEWTENGEAIKKQIKIVEEVHASDGEIIMSCHKFDSMIPQELAVRMGRGMESRGADIAKIVGRAQTYDDLIETLKTILLLKKELKIPFVHVSMGEYGKLSRIFGAMLGSCLVFCQHRLHPKGPLWHLPLITTAKFALTNIDWRVAFIGREDKILEFGTPQE